MTTTVPTAGPTPTPTPAPGSGTGPAAPGSGAGSTTVTTGPVPARTRQRGHAGPVAAAVPGGGPASTGCWRPSSASGRRPCATCPPP